MVLILQILQSPWATLDSFDPHLHFEALSSLTFCQAKNWLSSFSLAISPWLFFLILLSGWGVSQSLALGPFLIFSLCSALGALLQNSHLHWGNICHQF